MQINNAKRIILGAVCGDIIGSVYEWNNVKTVDFDLFGNESTFTDDSVLTFATMDAIINKRNYAEAYQTYGRRYPRRGYGGNFNKWIHSKSPEPYNSWGNGSAMRVSPVGWFAGSIDEAMDEAKKSAEVSHDHPEGIKGAQAVAAAVYMARIGKRKGTIKKFIVDTFNYDLDKKLDDIRPGYTFDVSCQGSVPQAIIAFLESADFENAIRLAISIGGDSDTIACIAGGIAEAYYKKIPDNIIDNVLARLPPELIKVAEEFSIRYGQNNNINMAVEKDITEFPHDDLQKIQELFHALIYERVRNIGWNCEWFFEENDEVLPVITNDLQNEDDGSYYAVAGMYGGFSYNLVERNGKPLLTVSSWSRVVGGSGQTHEITTEECKLVEEGFV